MVIILQTKPTYKVLFMDRQHDKCTHWLAGIQFLDSLSILMLRQDVVLNLTAIGMLSFNIVPFLDVGNLRSIKIYIELAVRIIYIDTHIHINIKSGRGKLVVYIVYSSMLMKISWFLFIYYSTYICKLLRFSIQKLASGL